MARDEGSTKRSVEKKQAPGEEDASLKKGSWTAEEDEKLVGHVQRHGEGNWDKVRRKTGLRRCGKSCRLRWTNHLRPDLKRGAMSPEEELLFLRLHALLGNKWARIAAHVEHEVALIRAGGPNTILDAGADDRVKPQERPPFLFDAADPLTLLSLPPPASDSPAAIYHFGMAAREPRPLPSIDDLKIDPSNYLPLAPLLPPMAHRELPSIQSAAIATGATLETAFLCDPEHQQVAAAASLVNFGTMPGLVSHENIDSSGPSGGRSSRSEGGDTPLHCTQEEGLLNLGGKRGCLSGDDEKPAKKPLASRAADDEEMPNLSPPIRRSSSSQPSGASMRRCSSLPAYDPVRAADLRRRRVEPMNSPRDHVNFFGI
uniref:HTH myb-type domain-containing protein n=1 Tax=Setaria viridis TaxID=4556 RepID=A0A4U6WIJ3_SETVI|nr:hypothetical protein SEVIR_1G076400v2 [Setaria viridis]